MCVFKISDAQIVLSSFSKKTDATIVLIINIILHTKKSKISTLWILLYIVKHVKHNLIKWRAEKLGRRNLLKKFYLFSILEEKMSLVLLAKYLLVSNKFIIFFRSFSLVLFLLPSSFRSLFLFCPVFFKLFAFFSILIFFSPFLPLSISITKECYISLLN